MKNTLKLCALLLSISISTTLLPFLIINDNSKRELRLVGIDENKEILLFDGVLERNDIAVLNLKDQYRSLIATISHSCPVHDQSNIMQSQEKFVFGPVTNDTVLILPCTTKRYIAAHFEDMLSRCNDLRYNLGHYLDPSPWRFEYLVTRGGIDALIINNDCATDPESVPRYPGYPHSMFLVLYKNTTTTIEAGAYLDTQLEETPRIFGQLHLFTGFGEKTVTYEKRIFRVGYCTTCDYITATITISDLFWYAK